MQIPTRRSDKQPRIKSDPHLTLAKYQELRSKLDHLLNVSRPQQAAEVKRLSTTGDYSENAGYQMAKGRLRGINNRILEIEDIIRRAEIIEAPTDCSRVALGHRVTVLVNGHEKKYQILGSAETRPQAGVISQQSPLGQILLGHGCGEIVSLKTPEREVDYKIIKIE